MATSNELLDDAKCDISQIDRGLIWYAVLAALLDVANGDPVPTDPDTLMAEAACLASQIDAGLVPYAILQAVSGITGGGGGATQVFSGNYGGGVPPVFPGTSAALAYDLDAPYQIWHWNAGTASWE